MALSSVSDCWSLNDDFFKMSGPGVDDASVVVVVAVVVAAVVVDVSGVVVKSSSVVVSCCTIKLNAAIHIMYLYIYI